MNKFFIFFFFLLFLVISCKEEKPIPLTKSDAQELDSIVSMEIGDTSNSSDFK